MAEFARHYAPPRGQLKQVARYLNGYGLRIDKLFGDNLAMTVSGPSAAFERAFSVQMHDYHKIGHDRHMRRAFHRPDHAPRLPKLLRSNGVLTVVGLSNQYQYQSLHTARPATSVEADPDGALAEYGRRYPRSG